MIFGTIRLLTLILTLLATVGAQGMASPAYIRVAMNEGRIVSVNSNTTFYTDQLKGCVVTLLKCEYQNGQKVAAMCHFSHDKKIENKKTLEQILSHVDTGATILSECVLIAPGILSGIRLTPIIDPEWKEMIIETICKQLPLTTFDIKTYLFNIETSNVTFTPSKKRAVHITNICPQEDLKNRDLLLICHNHKQESLCNKLLPLVLATSGLIGFFIYNCQ